MDGADLHVPRLGKKRAAKTDRLLALGRFLCPQPLCHLAFSVPIDLWGDLPAKIALEPWDFAISARFASRGTMESERKDIAKHVVANYIFCMHRSFPVRDVGE
jgi:hypothetical protein